MVSLENLNNMRNYTRVSSYPYNTVVAHLPLLGNMATDPSFYFQKYLGRSFVKIFGFEKFPANISK